MWHISNFYCAQVLSNCRDEHQQRRVIETAPPSRLRNERNILRHFEGHAAIRQLVDEVTDPPSLVLEYLDTDMLHESWKGGIQSSIVREVGWHTLNALAALHDAGFVHTGMRLVQDWSTRAFTET